MLALAVFCSSQVLSCAFTVDYIRAFLLNISFFFFSLSASHCIIILFIIFSTFYLNHLFMSFFGVYLSFSFISSLPMFIIFFTYILYSFIYCLPFIFHLFYYFYILFLFTDLPAVFPMYWIFFSFYPTILFYYYIP